METSVRYRKVIPNIWAVLVNCKPIGIVEWKNHIQGWVFTTQGFVSEIPAHTRNAAVLQWPGLKSLSV